MAEGSEPPEDLTRTLLGGQEFCFDFYCYPCHEDGRHFEAVGYCKDCRDYLCDECYRSHRRSKPSRHHVLLDSEHMPKDVTSTRRVVHTDRCTDTCNRHPDKVIEFYCHIHDALACSTCAFADHRHCDKVDLIADVDDRTGQNKEFIATQAQLQDLAQNAHQNIQTSQDSISLSKKYTNVAIKSIKTYTHETISTLEKFKKELEAEAKELDSKNEKKLKAASSESDSVLVEIQGTLQSLSILEQNKQYCDLFVAVHKAQKALLSMTRKLNKTQQDSTVDEFMFESNLKLQSILRHKGGIGTFIAVPAQPGDKINTLDELHGVSYLDDSKQTTTHTSVVTDDEHKLASSIDKRSHGSSTTCDTDLGLRSELRTCGQNSSIRNIAESAKRTPNPRKSSTSNTNKTNVHHNDVNARHVTDIHVKGWYFWESCNISGLAVFHEDKLLAVDKTNNKIKVIDITKRKVFCDFKLEIEPWCVSSVDRNNIAITLPYVNEIQYLNVSANGTISTSRTVKVNGICYGIAFARDKLWVSYIHPEKLEALTLDGEVLLCISTDDSGQEIFSWPNCVALSPDMETIYVSDFYKKSVIRLSSTGKLLSVCKLDYFPTGVAVAADGTVFTCSDGGRVYMLTDKCEMIKELLDVDQAGGAQSLAYDEDTGRLFVGSRDSDVIKIFQLTG